MWDGVFCLLAFWLPRVSDVFPERSVHCSIRGNVSFLVCFPQTNIFGYASGSPLDSENLPVPHPWRMLSNVCQMAKHMWDSLLSGEAKKKVHTSWNTSEHHYYPCSYNISPLSFFPQKLNPISPSPAWLNSLQRRMETKDNEFYTNRNKNLKINKLQNFRRLDHRSYWKLQRQYIWRSCYKEVKCLPQGHSS